MISVSDSGILNDLHLRLFIATWMLLPARKWDNQQLESHFWRLYQNDRPGAVMELEDGPYPMEAGRLYIIPAGVLFGSRNTDDFRQFFVHFDVIGLPPLALRALFQRPIRLPYDPALEEKAQALAQGRLDRHDREIDLLTACRIKALLYESLVRYLDSLAPEQRESGLRAAAALRPVLPAIQWVEDHLGERLSNATLAALCAMSEDHFIRRFRECAGTPPGQYILERRVAAASQRLLFTDASIERIADETGFGNRYYFTRVFTRHTGISPAAFRKAGRG